MVRNQSKKPPKSKPAPSAPKSSPPQDRLETSLLDLTPSSPCCPPNWRWLRANHAIATPKRLLRQLWGSKPLDDDVTDAIKYLRVRERIDPARRTALQAFNDLVAAETLNSSTSLRRTELEARLLAGEPHVDISRKTGFSLGIVKRYAALFYDVAERRTNPSYVVAELLPEEIHYAMREGDTDSLLKIFAFSGGVHMLEAGLRFLATPQPVIPNRLRDLPSSQLREMLQWLNIRVITLTMTYHPQSDWEKLKLHEATAMHCVRWRSQREHVRRTRTER